ncbi:MAG: MG2 domain-containing protein [Saprospiraceae bacterium]
MKTLNQFGSIVNLFGVFLLLFLFSNCNSEKTAKPIPNGMEEFISAYTSGIISKASPVKVVFNLKVAEEDEIGKAPENHIFTLEPAVEGELFWEDAQTLVFKPAEWLPSGKSFLGKIAMDKLVDNLPQELKAFEFDFKTRDLNVSLQIDGLSNTDPNSLAKQELSGSLVLSDVALPEAVEKMLTARQNGKELSLSWTHEGSTNVHNFKASGITRTDKKGEVQLMWDGNSIGLNEKGEKIIEIPSINDFKVMDARVVQDPEQYISIRFSDPILKNQSLEGLIRIITQNQDLKFNIDGNEVRVYPAARMTGSHQIQIEPGIQNIINIKMKNPSIWALEFEPMKPAVRFAGSGNILPNSSGLTLPFEAVNLSAVEVEVFKIYQNNVLQFLQRNDFNGDYDLERVGKIILQKKIILQSLNPKAQAGVWSRFALDLGTLIQNDPEAIYQVRIGFRPEYSLYTCFDQENQVEETNLNTFERNEDSGDGFVSIMSGWYGINGYYDDYQWSDREDPCKPAYYNSDNFISRNLFSSNLAITAKMGDGNKLFATVSNIRTTDPVSGANLEFYNYQQQLIKTMTTDGAGMVFTDLKEEPFAIIAKKGNDRGILKLGDGNSLSLSKFDVAGTENQKGIKGFIYGERGVWRPGDSIYLNFILEDEEGSLPAFHPVKYTLTDSRGQIQSKSVLTEGVHGMYAMHLGTSVDAPTGNWMMNVEVGGARFSKVLKVETVKPNRLKIKLDFGKEILQPEDNNLNGNLSVNWLHGAPAKNLDTKVELQLNTINTTFKGLDEFEFDDPSRKFYMDNTVIFDKKVDANGKATVNYELLKNKYAPGNLRAKFKTRAFEPGGNFSTDIFTLDYHPYETYVGVSIPKNKWGQQRLTNGEPGKLQMVSVQENGKPASNQTLSAGIYELDWNWWWDQSDNNAAKYNSTNHFNAIQKTTLKTDKDGKAEWPVTLAASGRYLVRVCDTESNHCTGTYFYVGYPWYREDENNNAKKEASILAFSSDKTTYEVGETVELSVPSGDVGRILLSLEGGSKVIESYWKDAKSGENKIRFTATKEMIPTVYAHVSLIQPHGQSENDLPIRMYGVIPIEIEDKKNKLQPKLEMPGTLAPEQTVNITVSEENGRDMAYTIAMVDEGLLDLTRFKTPDPYNAFFAKEALDVKTWDVYDEILGAYGGSLEKVLSVGGDGAINPSDAKRNANRFKPVVRHLGPFYLKTGEKAKHKITLPNYVGSVRTMVVAGKDGAYGSVDKTTPVKKPLMILATLPRVLGPGESLKLPVSVFAMENKVKNVNVQIRESSGLVSFKNGNSKSVNFTSPDEKLVYFDIDIKPVIGNAKFEILAEGNGEKASQTIEIYVRNPNPEQRKTINEVVEAGQTLNIPFEAIGIKGTNQAYLEVSSFAPFDLGAKLDYIIGYPYGCLEQTSSKGFAQLYLEKAVKLSETQKLMAQKNVKAAISKIKSFSNNKGGLSYWPGDSYTNHWAETFATHFLIEAKNLGYEVDPSFLDRLLNALSARSKLWDVKQFEEGFYAHNNDQLMQAYRLYVLALGGKSDLASMNRLREMKNLATTAKIRLAGAYALNGKKEVAESLINEKIPEIEDYREMSGSFGSSFRDQAMIIETYSQLGKRKEAFEFAFRLANDMNERSWFSTQEIAFAFLATGKLVTLNSKDQTLKFAYKEGSKGWVDAGSQGTGFLFDIPVDKMNERTIAVRNDGKDPIYVRLALSGRPVAGQETASEKHLKMSTKFFNMNGKEIDPSVLEQGTDFVAEAKITNPGNYQYNLRELALQQIFPSGWEITNTRLEGTTYFNDSSRPTYENFQDDRVYSFFNIYGRKTFTYRVVLTAAYEGRFYLPSFSCEAMYDPNIYANNAGRWITVSAAR